MIERSFAQTLSRWLVPRTRRDKLLVLVAFLLAPVLCLVLTAALTPLPPELRPTPPASDSSTVFLDRHGAVLCEVRASDGARSRPIALKEVGDRSIRALLAAEDRRFYFHPGVDPLSIGRAAIQLVLSRRIVSGASTITQQLARTLVPRPRGFVNKLREMALALRIEASVSKDRILEEYLNRVSFGPSLRGIEAASRFYFDKPTQDLSLAEAAALASLPRGPTLYDPRRGTERLLRRRDRVLLRMRSARLASDADIDRALREPLVIAPRGSGQGVPHLRYALLNGSMEPTLGPLLGRAGLIQTTIDRGLQREVELLAVQTIERLAARHVTAASVVVIENKTGEILSYLGSPDIENIARLGHNDGVLAVRQPGSALKPFVYGLGMEIAGMTAATLLPDVDLHFPTPDGDYHPNNYDGHFHGPVRLREALGSSLNVPAVVAASRIGPERLLERLHALGFASLDRSARDYGLALALGDGEVRLLELATAYATLARGGLFLPSRAMRVVKTPSGEPIPLPQREAREVLDPRVAFVITDILSDRHARLATFGENSVLELPFAVAAKTGTSKGYRDNVAVGFTPEFTVAVWVGNFDGSPMSGISGITGAGPLFHDIMLAASRLLPPRDFVRPDGLVDVEICPLSGGKPTSACPHRRTESFTSAAALELAPCAMHERVRLDIRNSQRAGPRCPLNMTDDRVFEVYPPELLAWASGAGRPLPPRGSSPFCPIEDDKTSSGRLRIVYPPDGARFVRDDALFANQAIRVRVDAPRGTRKVRLFVDRESFLLSPPFERAVPLVVGEHVISAEADGLASERVSFVVM